MHESSAETDLLSSRERTGCAKLYSVGVYTRLSKGARGILFPNNGDQGLAVENGKDTEGRDAALLQQGGEGGLIECMQNPMTNGFAQTSKIMQERLGLRAELVLVGLPKMPPVDRGEVGMGMKRRENEAAVRMECPMPFPERGEWRRHVG
jgi:hypothetical protein